MPVDKIRRGAASAKVGFPNANSIRVDPTTDVMYFGTSTSGTTEKQVADTSSTQTFTGKTFTSPTIANPTVTGNSVNGVMVTKVVPFVEQAGTTITGSVPIPAGCWVQEIAFVLTVLFGGTSAVLKVGDAADDDGYFTGVDCKATDLLVGEVLSTADDGCWGGKQGVYLTSAGRRGMAVGGNSGKYYGVADTIAAVVTEGTPSTTGRGFFIVTYIVPQTIAAVVA